MKGIFTLLKSIAEANWFSRFILATIIAAAVVVGLETSPRLLDEHGNLLHFFDKLILWIFTLEAAIKMGQHGGKWFKYFKDPWNVFDFCIVVVCFLPSENAQFAAVLRLARILRALRLITAVPRLQVLVSCLLKSIPSMFYVGILLFLMFYIYGVVGVFMFRENDPVHFPDLSTSLLTLFRVVTLEDWTDVMYIQMYGFENYTGGNFDPAEKKMPLLGAAYFVSFVGLGTMIMLNLFIGVIISSMDEAQDEKQKHELADATAAGTADTLLHDAESIEQQIVTLQESLHRLRLRLENAEARKPPKD